MKTEIEIQAALKAEGIAFARRVAAGGNPSGWRASLQERPEWIDRRWIVFLRCSADPLNSVWQAFARKSDALEVLEAVKGILNEKTALINAVRQTAGL